MNSTFPPSEDQYGRPKFGEAVYPTAPPIAQDPVEAQTIRSQTAATQFAQQAADQTPPQPQPQAPQTPIAHFQPAAPVRHQRFTQSALAASNASAHASTHQFPQQQNAPKKDQLPTPKQSKVRSQRFGIIWIGVAGILLLLAAAGTVLVSRWEEISEWTKLGGFTATVLALLGTGHLLRKTSPISSRVVTAAGALLLPFNIAAAMVLQDVSSQVVLLGSSVLSALAYYLLMQVEDRLELRWGIRLAATGASIALGGLTLVPAAVYLIGIALASFFAKRAKDAQLFAAIACLPVLATFAIVPIVFDPLTENWFVRAISIRYEDLAVQIAIGFAASLSLFAAWLLDPQRRSSPTTKFFSEESFENLVEPRNNVAALHAANSIDVDVLVAKLTRFSPFLALLTGARMALEFVENITVSFESALLGVAVVFLAVQIASLMTSSNSEKPSRFARRLEVFADAFIVVTLLVTPILWLQLLIAPKESAVLLSVAAAVWFIGWLVSDYRPEAKQIIRFSTSHLPTPPNGPLFTNHLKVAGLSSNGHLSVTLGMFATLFWGMMNLFNAEVAIYAAALLGVVAVVSARKHASAVSAIALGGIYIASFGLLSGTAQVRTGLVVALIIAGMAFVQKGRVYFGETDAMNLAMAGVYSYVFAFANDGSFINNHVAGFRWILPLVIALPWLLLWVTDDGELRFAKRESLVEAGGIFGFWIPRFSLILSFLIAQSSFSGSNAHLLYRFDDAAVLTSLVLTACAVAEALRARKHLSRKVLMPEVLFAVLAVFLLWVPQFERVVDVFIDAGPKAGFIIAIVAAALMGIVDLVNEKQRRPLTVLSVGLSFAGLIVALPQASSFFASVIAFSASLAIWAYRKRSKDLGVFAGICAAFGFIGLALTWSDAHFSLVILPLVLVALAIGVAVTERGGSSWAGVALPLGFYQMVIYVDRHLGAPVSVTMIGLGLAIAAVIYGGSRSQAGAIYSGIASILGVILLESLTSFALIPVWAWFTIGGAVLLVAAVLIEGRNRKANGSDAHSDAVAGPNGSADAPVAVGAQPVVFEAQNSILQGGNDALYPQAPVYADQASGFLDLTDHQPAEQLSHNIAEAPTSGDVQQHDVVEVF